MPAAIPTTTPTPPAPSRSWSPRVTTIGPWAMFTNYQVLHERPHVVYSGNTQGRHAREPGAKGCVLVGVENGELTSLEFRETDVLRWYRETIALDSGDDEDALLDRTRIALERIAGVGRGPPGRRATAIRRPLGPSRNAWCKTPRGNRSSPTFAAGRPTWATTSGSKKSNSIPARCSTSSRCARARPGRRFAARPEIAGRRSGPAGGAVRIAATAAAQGRRRTGRRTRRLRTASIWTTRCGWPAGCATPKNCSSVILSRSDREESGICTSTTSATSPIATSRSPTPGCKSSTDRTRPAKPRCSSSCAAGCSIFPAAPPTTSKPAPKSPASARSLLADGRLVELRRRKGTKNKVSVKIDGCETDLDEAGFAGADRPRQSQLVRVGLCLRPRSAQPGRRKSQAREPAIGPVRRRAGRHGQP